MAHVPWFIVVALCVWCGHSFRYVQKDGLNINRNRQETLLERSIRAAGAGTAAAVLRQRAASVEAAVAQVLKRVARMYNISVQFGFSDSSGSVSLASGVDNVWSGSKLQPSTLLPLGSATKPFTAIQVLRAVEAGKLSLSDKAVTYVDPVLNRLYKTNLAKLFGNSAADVTVKDLLAMTSGFPDYVNKFIKNATLFDPGSDIEPITYLESAATRENVCKPGKCAFYSGINYLLLGFVLMELQGVKNWEELDQMAVFPSAERKAGRYKNFKFAKRGRCCDYQEDIAHQVSAYEEGGKLVFHDIFYNSCLNGWTMGNIMSSAGDMAKFWHDVSKGKLVKKTTLQGMMKFRPMSLWCKQCGYGLGIMNFHWTNFFTRDPKAKIYGHQGTDYGSLAKLCGFNPKYGFSMCIAFPEVQGRQCGRDSVLNAQSVPMTSCAIYQAVLTAVGHRGPRLHCKAPRGKLSKSCEWRRQRNGDPSFIREATVKLTQSASTRGSIEETGGSGGSVSGTARYLSGGISSITSSDNPITSEGGIMSTIPTLRPNTKGWKATRRRYWMKKVGRATSTE